MKLHFPSMLAVGIAWALFLAFVVLPLVLMVFRLAAEGTSHFDYSVTTRQLALLMKTAGLCAVATAFCVGISLPAAYAIGFVGGGSRQAWPATILLVCLLCPPMVYAFGWQRLLPASLGGEVQCVWTWAIWAWPIPATIIGLTWARVGRSSYDAARLLLAGPAAFIRVVLPTLMPSVGLSSAILFVLFAGDYGVPHACLINVYSTDLLGRASVSPGTGQVAWLALPWIIVTVSVAVVALAIWSRARNNQPNSPADMLVRPRFVVTTLGFYFIVSWCVPLVAFSWGTGSIDAIINAATIYGRDFVWSLVSVLFGAVMVLAISLGLSTTRRGSLFALVAALLMGALPGALVGESLIVAFNRSSMSWLYDHWPILSLAYLSRFLWVGIVAVRLVFCLSPKTLSDQARVDGANETAVFWRISMAAGWPILLIAATMVTALSIADLSASTLVRVPLFNPIAHVLVEKFHRFEDDMVFAISVWLVLTAIVPAVIQAVALRGRRLTG